MSRSTTPEQADADRNLLFGVLAMQVDLIDAAQFVEACSCGASRKSVPLADLLVERGWLTQADRDDVERLLRRKSASTTRTPAPASAPCSTPRCAAPSRIDDEAVRQSLTGSATRAERIDGALRRAGPVAPPARPAARRGRHRPGARWPTMRSSAATWPSRNCGRTGGNPAA